MTKLIAALIIAVVLYGGWHLFLYWEEVKNEKETEQKKQQAATIDPSRLDGMPYSMESSLQAAQKRGPAALKEWVKANSRVIQDPRKAWIELDYCVMIARDDPAEARRVFASVKQRTPSSSPVWARVKSLEKTYE